MGRWDFRPGGDPDAPPMYIPDEGEEGGGGMLGHLASGLGQTWESLGDAATALAGAPGVRQGLTALGAPGRAVTAVGHSMAPGGYQGTTDPIDYIMTGRKEGPEDLAGYGDLLAGVMSAEGTVDEQGYAAKALRAAGNTISDPLVLFGAARAAAAPVPARPPVSAPRVAGAAGKGAGKALARRTYGPEGWTPGGGGGGGGGTTDKQLMRAMREGATDAPRAPASPRARYRHPPVDPEDAARFPSAPLDTDLASPGAFTTGGVKKGVPTGRAPKGAKAARQAERRGRAREMGREEQLGEGVGKMRQEQLQEGVGAMGREFGPQPLPTPRDALRAMLQATVEQGGSADDVMRLLSQLGG